MIAKISALRGSSVTGDDRVFVETCRDVLRIDAVKITRGGVPAGVTWLDDVIARHCPSRPRRSTRNQTKGQVPATNGHHVVNESTLNQIEPNGMRQTVAG